MNNLAIIEPETELPASSSLSLALPANLSFERWQDIGRELAAREKVLNWWIGDWWAFGEHRYGDKAKVAAEGCFGLSYSTLSTYGTVARAFEPSRRLETVPFSSYQEAAPIARQSPDAAQMLMERAGRESMSVASLRAAVRTLQGREVQPRSTPDADSFKARVYRAFNCLPTAEERMEVAEAIAAVIETGSLIDPDSGEPIAR